MLSYVDFFQVRVDVRCILPKNSNCAVLCGLLPGGLPGSLLAGCGCSGNLTRLRARCCHVCRIRSGRVPGVQPSLLPTLHNGCTYSISHSAPPSHPAPLPAQPPSFADGCAARGRGHSCQHVPGPDQRARRRGHQCGAHPHLPAAVPGGCSPCSEGWGLLALGCASPC